MTIGVMMPIRIAPPGGVAPSVAQTAPAGGFTGGHSPTSAGPGRAAKTAAVGGSRAVAGALALGLVASVVAVVGVAPAAAEPVFRPEDPVVVTGRTLRPLFGVAPDRVAAFRREAGAWVPIPVQVDERAVVDFGSEPTANDVPGATGTVYGTQAIGVVALQYTDPDTWVGPDPNPAVDGNDEVALMARDAGEQALGADPPEHVAAATGVELSITDPLEPGAQSWVYLFAHDGTLDPSAGQHLVDYDFSLASGDYKATYLRAEGPNPEDSTVTTAAYAHHFSDRWVDDELHITARRRHRGRHPRSAPQPVRPLRVRAQRGHVLGRRGRLRRQPGRAGPGHPLVPRRQQRAAQPAHPPLLRGPPRDRERPPGSCDPGDDGDLRLQPGRGGHDVSQLGDGSGRHHRRGPRRRVHGPQLLGDGAGGAGLADQRAPRDHRPGPPQLGLQHVLPRRCHPAWRHVHGRHRGLRRQRAPTDRLDRQHRSPVRPVQPLPGPAGPHVPGPGSDRGRRPQRPSAGRGPAGRHRPAVLRLSAPPVRRRRRPGPDHARPRLGGSPRAGHRLRGRSTAPT